ncbi:MAG: O-antigen ligase family protein [Candidatus Staskawiczbacteria bacterium]
MKQLFKNINLNKKELLGFLFFIGLWLLIWATYNADLFRIFEPGFPHGAIELIHGLRTFLPLVSSILAVIFLIIKRDNFPKNFFLTPLGLLSLYAGIGIISSIFSKSPLGSLYWGSLYAAPIIVLSAILVSANPLKKISTIININWAIAGILSVLLIIIFLIQPGVITSLTTNFLICQERPFEGIAGIITAAPSLGMFGSRPTGLGRYAGVAVIIALAYLLGEKMGKKYFIWLLSFIISFLILLFSKGRTALAAFLVAMVGILWFHKKFKTYWVLFLGLAFLLTVSVTFFNIPCANGLDFINSLPQYSIFGNSSSITNNYKDSFLDITEPAITVPGIKSIWTIVTLSGRVTGAWKEAYALFLESPWVGYGFQADRYFLNGQHAHNTIVQAILQTGLSGTLLLMVAFILTFIYLCQAFFRKGIEKKEKHFLLGMIGVFIFFAGRSVTESSGAYFDADWLFLAPIVAYAQYLKNFKFNENKNI